MTKKDSPTNLWANDTVSDLQNKNFFTSGQNGTPNGPTHVMSMTNYFNKTVIDDSSQQNMGLTAEGKFAPESQFAAEKKMCDVLPGNNTVGAEGRSEMNYRRAKEMYAKEIEVINGEAGYGAVSQINYNELYKIMGYDDVSGNVPMEEINEESRKWRVIDGGKIFENLNKIDDQFAGAIEAKKNWNTSIADIYNGGTNETINFDKENNNGDIFEIRFREVLPGVIDLHPKNVKSERWQLALKIQKVFRGYLSRKHRFNLVPRLRFISTGRLFNQTTSMGQTNNTFFRNLN